MPKPSFKNAKKLCKEFGPIDKSLVKHINDAFKPKVKAAAIEAAAGILHSKDSKNPPVQIKLKPEAGKRSTIFGKFNGRLNRCMK